MKRITYKCTLLAHVVISANSATEGNHGSLDYIPGSKFLGIVAGKEGNYNMENANQTLDLFHNGKVRFGDAHPYVKGERLELMPLSWQIPKGQEDEGAVYLHHHLDSKKRGDLINKGIQLKQAKGRYFSNSFHSYSVPQRFSMKSAYDKSSMRSKEGQMFGYAALEKGSTWSFTIDFDEDTHVDIVNKALLGHDEKGAKHRLGRSKSAEYGWVKIEKIGESKPVTKNVQAGLTCLYAASNLCFYDEDGNNTLKPTAAQLNLPAGTTILWQKSQIRSKLYRTWNRKRESRNADRVVIQKGSVFRVLLKEGVGSEKFIKGVGSHRSEGFGQVYLHPSFLDSDSALLGQVKGNFKEKGIAQNIQMIRLEGEGEEDKIIIDFLGKRSSNNEINSGITEKVNQFIKDFVKDFEVISRSQWGQIRKYAKLSSDAEVLEKMLFDNAIGFCYRGQSEKDWRQKGRRDLLKKFLFSNKDMNSKEVIDLTMKLASEMAKVEN